MGTACTASQDLQVLDYSIANNHDKTCFCGCWRCDEQTPAREACVAREKISDNLSFTETVRLGDLIRSTQGGRVNMKRGSYPVFIYIFFTGVNSQPNLHICHAGPQ